MKTIWITGGSSGIGLATAKIFDIKQIQSHTINKLLESDLNFIYSKPKYVIHNNSK